MISFGRATSCSTGEVEVTHAYLVIDGADGTAALFLPHQDRHSVEAEGEHLSADNVERARELTSVDRVAALRGAAAFFAPLSPAEGARSSWDTLRRAQKEAEADPFDGGPAREAAFAGLLAAALPGDAYRGPVAGARRDAAGQR